MDIRLNIPPALAAKMDRALITPEDARGVIGWCESSGVKLLDNATGDIVGHLRSGALTYWVRYRSEEGTYTLCNIYAHRASMEEECP